MSTSTVVLAPASQTVESEIPLARNEELAGPSPQTTAPVTQAERISSIDLLRGFSLMGILVMNITDFALPGWDYLVPLTTVKPVFSGPHWKANTIAWFLRWILAEGKMRALFSMLFGAGVILLTGRAEERGAGVRTADIYTRRNMWLVLFGMLHCFLIWNGDILFYYGTAALLFMFPFRHCRPKTLIWTAAIVLLLNTAVVQVGQTIGYRAAKKSADKASYALAHHQVITDDQIAALNSWGKVQDHWRPSTKKLYKDITAHHTGYLAALASDAGDGFKGEAIGAYAGFGDWVGMMLLGMALYRLGFFSLRASTRTYAIIAIVGLGLSWSITFAGCWYAWRGGFDLFATRRLLDFPYDLTRLTGALGNASVLLLMVRFGLFKWVLGRIAAVGQMAFSNYILTSLCMRTLFVWSPLHWYGYVEYYKLYYVVAGMWLVNLVFSAVWLRFFLFGPLEWCWRSLTYWHRQPMRIQDLHSSNLQRTTPTLAGVGV